MRFSSSSSKPLSSPGRTDKFPPPLMRFLRTNTSSKSHRARSRSSPMFITRRKNSIEPSNRASTKIPEPSSPKVTCMGQVRVKRSKPPKSRTRSHSRNPRKASSSVCRCQWLIPFPKALFSRPKLGKLASFLQLSFRRRAAAKEEINGIADESSANRIEPRFVEEDDSEERFAVVPSPPKNALILTRCRSAPYRSSSLARRFWESPLKGDGEEEEEEEEEEEKSEEAKKSVGIEDEKAPIEDEEEGELGLGLGFAVLTRCNSEPVRSAEKKLGTGPEFGSRKNDRDRGRRRRFGFINSIVF